MLLNLPGPVRANRPVLGIGSDADQIVWGREMERTAQDREPAPETLDGISHFVALGAGRDDSADCVLAWLDSHRL